MTLSDDELELALRIVKRLLSKNVVGAHHKQPQTIAGWFATHERGDVKQVIDVMTSDRSVPVREKGRGTVQLTSVEAGKQFLRDNGVSPPREW